jgi:mono/diheme cytochrome c family protein
MLTATFLAATAPSAGACPPPGAGFFTAAQAAAGEGVFDGHCSACHGADLSGGAGPALAGSQFQASLEFSKITGAQLLAFISTQMPYNAPGSLTKAQYQDAFAYILSVNHYPAGPYPLDASSADCVQMLPYPKQH